MLTVRPLCSLSLSVFPQYSANQLLYCAFVFFHKRSLLKDLNKNHALGLAFLSTFWRGQELRIDPFLSAEHFFLPILSGLCKMWRWIKVCCAAQRCGIVLLVAQLPVRPQETSPGKQVNTKSFLYKIWSIVYYWYFFFQLDFLVIF